jgi:uncharacterized protein (DUF2267 family)
MKTAEPEVIERSAQKTREWIDQVATELGDPDRRRAYRELKAVLHTLRDRVPVNEAAQLAAQLPELLRGAYYENWVPAHTPQRYRTRDEFLSRIAEAGGMAGETEASYALTAVMKVLRRHVSAGEIADVMADMPHDVAALLEV